MFSGFKRISYLRDMEIEKRLTTRIAHGHTKCSEETKERMRKSQKQRWAERKSNLNLNLI